MKITKCSEDVSLNLKLSRKKNSSVSNFFLLSVGVMLNLAKASAVLFAVLVVLLVLQRCKSLQFLI